MAGTLKKRQRLDKYTQVSNDTLRNPNLSWKAKGLLCYLLSHDEGFEIRKRNIHMFATDGYDSTNSAFKELEENGYIRTLGTGRDEKGNFIGYDYEFDEKPVFFNNKLGSQEKNSPGDTFNPIGITRHGSPDTVHPTRKTPNKEEQYKEEQVKNNKHTKKNTGFSIPTLQEVELYFKEKGLNSEYAKKAFDYYESGNWHDSKGNKVLRWKQKMLVNWIDKDQAKQYELKEEKLQTELDLNNDFSRENFYNNID